MLRAGLKLKIYEDKEKRWKEYTIEKKLEKQNGLAKCIVRDAQGNKMIKHLGDAEAYNGYQYKIIK